MEKNNSFENLKGSSKKKNESQHKKPIKFVTPQKIATLEGFTVTSKKTNLTTNKTIIQ